MFFNPKKHFLEKIRIPSRELPTLKKVINTTLIFLLGVGLGIFSKWLDNLSIDDSILWQHILGILDLGNIFSMFGVWILIATSISIFSNTPLRAGINVFVFFLGMCFRIQYKTFSRPSVADKKSYLTFIIYNA